MITLSEEQRKKIEKNKAAAILKKQQAAQKVTSSATSSDSARERNGKNFVKSPIKVVWNTKIHSTVISASCKVFGEDRFIVEMPYYGASIEVFKTINGRKYEVNLKKWSFPLSEQPELLSRLNKTCPEVVINAIPNSVLKILSESHLKEPVGINWSKIDKTLREYLLPFQVEGVKFGILMNGKCMIADDMGLGKTIQALGIAHYFKENWPLLIICPSSMRFPWREAIKTFLPSVKIDIQILVTGKDQVVEADIVISSYDLMKNCFKDLTKKKFGMIIFDESHSLKSSKAKRTTVALELCRTAKNVVLLSGTPALSRPEELYSQIIMIDPFTFKSMYEFGMRYCNGKKNKYGWDFSGSSNLEELEMYMKKKIMIRRLKTEVIQQLPSKIRKVVILNPEIVNKVSKKMQKLESDYINETGAKKHSTLLAFYSASSEAKLKAVCEYIEEKLECENKFLVFAHHVIMLNEICKLLERKNVQFIRIDGHIDSQLRKTYCDEFQNHKQCRVAVLSITAANCGITLTAAQLVIFAELYWNPGVLTQAEDRAHRIGQKDSVVIEYLVAKGTADDLLWKLIGIKLNVLNQAGLSKDNFKNTEVESHIENNQPKITSMLEHINKITHNDTKNICDDLFLEEADNILSNINLEEIENEYQMSNKKRKTSEG